MKVGFVFSGQGAQAVGMGKDLFEQIPAASEIFNKADKILGWSLSDICFNGPESKLTETRYCQPTIYTMSAACLEAFKEKNSHIIPAAAAGLSLGEFTALYSAEAFSFETGLRIIEKRAIYMQEACNATKGTMASIMKGGLDVIQECCSRAGVDIANINSSGQIVISGEETKVANAISSLKEKGMSKVIPLKVAGAYHSRLMKTAETKLAEYLTSISFNVPKIPVSQNFTGKLENEPSKMKQNVISQVTGSVQWVNCVNSMAESGIDTIIEFGPGNVLTGLIKRINSNINTVNVNSVESLLNFKI